MTIERPPPLPDTTAVAPGTPIGPIRRHRPWVRLVVAALFAVHGLIHLFGSAGAFGLVGPDLLVAPAPAVVGACWLAATLLCWGSAVLVLTAPRWWWVTGLVAVVVSQSAIITAWSDARAGTVVNIVLLVAVMYGCASRGPWSLRAEYERALATSWPPTPETIVTADDLAPLPEPVRRYLERAGVVGKPVVHDFRATWTGRIRSSADSPWVPFTAEQLDTTEPPRRFFRMDTTMKGLPVDVLHVVDGRGATMRVRLCSARSMVDAKGAGLTRAETVSVFNDLCLYAPCALLSSRVTWEPVDRRSAVAHFTLGPNTVAAELHVDEDGDLVDFVSDDRAATSPDGRRLTAVRWSTPIRGHARFGSARVPAGTSVRWHPTGEAWIYGDFRLTSLSYDTGRTDHAGNRHPGPHLVPPTDQMDWRSSHVD